MVITRYCIPDPTTYILQKTRTRLRLTTMSDFKGLFQTVTVFVAFILILLCLFAGTQKNFLEDVDLLTVSPIVIQLYKWQVDAED